MAILEPESRKKGMNFALCKNIQKMYALIFHFSTFIGIYIFLFLSYSQPWGHKRFQHSTSASWQSNTFNDIRQALFGWMKTFYIIRYLTIYFCLLYSSWTTLTMRMRATTEKIVPIRHKIFLLLIWNLLSSLCLS